MKKARSSYNIAVIGDTSSGKTMLLFGLILTSKKGLHVVSKDHQPDIEKAREKLQKGEGLGGTTSECIYNLGLRQGGIETPLVFKDYTGGGIENGKSFFETKIRGEQKDFSPDGVLFVLNPGQEILNLDSDSGADDLRLTKLTNLVNGIAGDWDDCKCHAIAAAVTAADRISKEGDLYAYRSKFFEIFNRYIVDPLKNSVRGIACKTDFEISVTGHVESQDKLKIIPNNNAADPFLWLIDRIDRRKHPIRYWTRRLWPLFTVVLLAGVGFLTWRYQNAFVDSIREDGEYTYKVAQQFVNSPEFVKLSRKEGVPNEENTRFDRWVGALSNYVSRLEGNRLWFFGVMDKRDVAHRDLLSKYLLLEADSAFLKSKKNITKDYVPAEHSLVRVLRISDCVITEPETFREYVAKGYSNEVEVARKRLADHQANNVPEIVSEYNENYFDAKCEWLQIQTNAAQWASHENIQALTNQLAPWKRECSVTLPLSNKIEEITSLITNSCPTWRVQHASNVVFHVANFGHVVRDDPDQIFAERSKIGREIRKLLATEEPILQMELDKAKVKLIEDCRTSYFRLGKFKKDAREYPSDDNLTANLMSLVQGMSLTNRVATWKSDLHNRQHDWLGAESGRIKDEVQKAKEFTAFLVRPREGIGARVHDFLVCVAKWAQEEKDVNKQKSFDEDCRKVWEQFRERYFADMKWKHGNNSDYPKAEANLEEKIIDFLKETRITNIQQEYDKWVSETRSKQKEWLIDEMKRCKEEFKSFDSDGNNCGDISGVLEASQSFVNEMLSGNEEDRKRVDAVKKERDDLVGAIKKMYFGSEEFGSSYPFSKPEENWKSSYGDAEREIDDGLSRIFKDKDTGFNFVEVTNDWKRCLWQHERDWLLESKRVCTNSVSKFDGKTSTIVDFVTSKKPNDPYLWQYVLGVKNKGGDLGIKKFKMELEDYAKRSNGMSEKDVTERYTRLNECFEKLHKNAFDISTFAESREGRYTGLSDIFTLRHLYTNGTPANVTSTMGIPANGSRDWKEQLREKAEAVINVASADCWLLTRYKIKNALVTLYHPKGVIAFKHNTVYNDDQDRFYLTVCKGSVDDYVFLGRNFFKTEKSGQAPNPWHKTMSVDHEVSMRLFSDIVITGGIWEAYERTDAKGYSSDDPPGQGSEKKPISWKTVICVPHLQTGLPSRTQSYLSYANMRMKPKTKTPDDHQDAKLTLSIDGEVIGPTPYDRIDACIKKAQEMESDLSNVWLKRYSEAEARLEELNKILSDGDESDVGGQP